MNANQGNICKTITQLSLPYHHVQAPNTIKVDFCLTYKNKAITDSLVVNYDVGDPDFLGRHCEVRDVAEVFWFPRDRFVKPTLKPDRKSPKLHTT